MNYKQTIEYLYNCTPVFEHVGATAYKEGLSNTLALDEHFGHPHKQFKSIHIAGTNGKGSCSHTLAAILQSEGYKVGLYTSPHLVDFRERIRVNGECISEDYVVTFVEQEKSFFEPLHPSFFELTTALAFKYFAEQKVDYAIIEVGLGGRLDCTNIIRPILSIITNISFDHTQFLGNTLSAIAGEKAGIIKPNTPVVIGEAIEETQCVFLDKAKKEGAPIVFAEDEQECLNVKPQAKGGIEYETKSFGCLYGELGGLYQAKNTNTVLNAVKILKAKSIIKNNESISKGFANVCSLTGLLGRWQKINDRPLVICDTGHNVGGWNYLSKQIKAQKCDQLRIVFGMVDDKDIKTVLKMLPKNAIFYFTKAKSKRAIPETKVADLAHQIGLNGRTFANVADAYKKALADASENDFIFVGGSSYIVADLLASFA